MSQEDRGGIPTSSRFGDLDPATRSRLVRRSALRSVAAPTLILVAYALVPIARLIDGPLTSRTYVRAAIAIGIALVVLASQLRAVITARYPQLQVIEGFTLAIPLILVVFASTYLSMTELDRDAFTEPLGKVGALYFALTTMTTVGFGDISARSDAARVMVMVQMVVSFGVIGIAGKIAYSAVQRRLEAG